MAKTDNNNPKMMDLEAVRNALAINGKPLSKERAKFIIGMIKSDHSKFYIINRLAFSKYMIRARDLDSWLKKK